MELSPQLDLGLWNGWLLLAIFKDTLGQIFPILSLLLFFGALVGSFFLYGFVMKRIQAKIDMDKYFDPIFKKRKQ